MPQYLIYKNRKCGSTARSLDAWEKDELILEAQRRGIAITKSMTVSDLCQSLIKHQEKEARQEAERKSRQSRQEAEKKTRKTLPQAEVKKLSRLEETLTIASRETNLDQIHDLLIICANLYYHGGQQTYQGQTYTSDDMPSDEFYDAFRAQYLPKQDPSKEMPVDPSLEVQKVKHPYPMGSLRKYRAAEICDLRALYSHLDGKPNSILIQGKVDGVSLRCWLDQGRLTLALTRYDHDKGVVKTDKASLFVTRPPFKGQIVIRGEAIVRTHEYQTIARAGQTGFTTPLAAAVGLMNQKGITGIKQYLHWIPYEITDEKGTGENTRPSQLEQLVMLKKLGYEIPPYKVVSTAELTAEYLQQLLLTWRSQVNYSMDGLVICPVKYQLEPIDTPRLKVAFKGANLGQWTKVTSIIPRATRTGLVIPQVYIEPVLVGGSKISTIAGANYNKLREKGINVGVEAYVVKANEIIPFIEAVRIPQRYHPVSLEIPVVCPSCGATLVTELESHEIRILRCPNPECPEKMTGSIEHFMTGIGVTGIGKKTISKLMATNPSIENLYNLSVEGMTQIEGIGRKIAQSLYQQLRDKINPINEDDLLVAISPPTIGSAIANLIIDQISIEELFGMKPLPLQRLTAIKGLGQVRAKILINYHDKGRALLEMLKQYGLKIASLKQLYQYPQHPEVICLTGRGSKTRAEYEKLIHARGWRTASTISGNVTILISSGIESTKAKEAKQLGIRVISYDEFDQILG